MYELPDLVGITISVLYPSEINIVNKLIDDMCDEKTYFAVYGGAAKNEALQTRYGSLRSGNGYHACHYYLRPRNSKNEPIVEVQVKTVLHDAWGIKTHDLTYKNSVSIDSLTLKQFESLGEIIAHLDQQSDALRSSIIDSHIVGVSKKRLVQFETILHPAREASKGATAHCDLLTEIEKMASERDPFNIGGRERANLSERAISVYDEHPTYACLLLSALATITGDTSIRQTALERISMWQAAATDSQSKLKAMLFSHLANFCFSDTVRAVEVAEEALTFIETEGGAKLEDDSSKLLTLRRKNSLVSTLAYYHAELVGSDEGAKRGSSEKAAAYLQMSFAILQELGLIENGESDLQRIVESLKEDENSQRLYWSIDNAIFVKIRLSQNVSAVKEALEILKTQMEKRPSSLGALADLLHDLHEYHARVRLLELETLEAKG